MFDENSQNNTQMTDQNNLVSTDLNSQVSPVTTDTPDDFPMVSPAADLTTSAPSDPVVQSSHPTYSPDNSSHISDMAPSQDLISIKKSALQQLSPLVDKLDQTPEEKFKTMLMMIQASDDQSMINSAFEIAQKITDEKAKAQALLDIVNEINYFTQTTESE